MLLRPEEATRVVRFCLAGDGWGEAVYEEETAVVYIVVNRAPLTATHRFEATTFEEALEQAIAEGLLKRSSVERQIAFVTGAAKEDGAAPADGAPDAVNAKLFASVTAAVSALVHETQRERGISSLYTASWGRTFGTELVDQWPRTDQQRAELAVLRRNHGDRMPAAVRHQLDAVEKLLANIVASRERVRAVQTLPPELMAAYSRLNAEILRTIDQLSVKVTEPQQRQKALAWLALLYAKEKTGIERAHLASAFARNQFFEGQRLAVSGLIAGRECYLHLFATAAPSAIAQQMRLELDAVMTGAVERMEKIALDNEHGGFRVDATTWFAAMSRVVDTLNRVEVALRVSFAAP
jgi:hypothetical protein